MSNQISVVIIDDNTSLSYLMKDGIDNLEDFHVSGIAHDGESGIALINEILPDVVILDIVMPKLDGLGVLEHFKLNNPINHDIEFVVLSALEHDLVTRHAITLGALYYLVKPIEMDTLILRLEQLFLGSGGPLESKTKNEFLGKKYDKLINDELCLLGVPMHVKGYQYLKRAIKMFIVENGHNVRITQEIYPVLAKEYLTTASNVERAIRNAIEITITRGNVEYIGKYFKNRIFNNKITNKEFILEISSSISRNL